MNFQRGRYKEEPEINLVPLIDVMMVILIFLMITTTYSKYTELQINLPTADAEKQLERSNEVSVLVNATGTLLITYWPLALTSTLTSPGRSICFSASAVGRLICNSVYLE